MRWRGRERSTNVEDIRARGPARRGGLAIGGGLGLVIAIVVLLMGGDPTTILQGGGPQAPEAPFQPTAEEEDLVEFVSIVLKDTEDVWHEQFRRLGRRYEEPKLVIFRGSVDAGGCGLAGAGVGPFYCPATKKLYIDLSFYGLLRDRLGAPGDFAQAYVIAHEVGHHVQNLLGQSAALDRARGRVSQTEYNKLSVRLELQADFYAGLWAHHAERSKQILERGDVEEAMNAASKIGDDALQRKSQGHVVPDSFTHGSSAQRMAWFRHGLDTGDIRQGDTFDDRIYDAVNPR